MLGSNIEELETNPWLDLSRIIWGLGIPDEMAKTTTRNKSITLSAHNISQNRERGNKNAVRKTYPSGKQYLSPQETSEGGKYLHTFARRDHGWEVGK